MTLDRSAVTDLAWAGNGTRSLRGVDAVVHLAAIAHARGVAADRLQDVNRDLPIAIGRACADAGVHLVFLSSAKVHGEESGDAPFHESSAFAPADDYASAKADAENALRAIARLRCTTLRPPLVYGPGVKANFLALMRAIAQGWPLPLSRVENRRSLVFVENLADAIRRCVEAPQRVGGTFLVSDGMPLSTPALCQKLAASLGVAVRCLPIPVSWLEQIHALRKLTRSFEINDRAIRSGLGWVPPVTTDEGIAATARWFRGLS